MANKVAGVYRTLLRARLDAFRGDVRALEAARVEIRGADDEPRAALLRCTDSLLRQV
jgi:hypothetical protein